jgi:hypothetical protein
VKLVLIDDPGRAYLPRDGLVTRDLKEFRIKRLEVCSLASYLELGQSQGSKRR